MTDPRYLSREVPILIGERGGLFLVRLGVRSGHYPQPNLGKMLVRASLECDYCGLQAQRDLDVIPTQAGQVLYVSPADQSLWFRLTAIPCQCRDAARLSVVLSPAT